MSLNRVAHDPPALRATSPRFCIGRHTNPNAPMKPIVDARAVHKHFGALHVLKGVDLKVAERELVFVFGPSGSG